MFETQSDKSSEAVCGEYRMTFGRFFEEFSIGQEFRHWPGRTISEADDTWFSLLTQNQNPIHIDANYSANNT